MLAIVEEWEASVDVDPEDVVPVEDGDKIVDVREVVLEAKVVRVGDVEVVVELEPLVVDDLVGPRTPE